MIDVDEILKYMIGALVFSLPEKDMIEILEDLTMRLKRLHNGKNKKDKEGL